MAQDLPNRHRRISRPNIFRAGRVCVQNSHRCKFGQIRFKRVIQLKSPLLPELHQGNRGHNLRVGENAVDLSSPSGDPALLIGTPKILGYDLAIIDWQ